MSVVFSKFKGFWCWHNHNRSQSKGPGLKSVSGKIHFYVFYPYAYKIVEMILTNLTKYIKIHVRRAAAGDILKFTCICVCVCIYVCIYLCVSRLLATLTTIQTWNLAHILPLTLSKNGFFVFLIKSPWRPLASKNCRVTWIFRISPRLPYLAFNQLRLKCLNYGAPRIFLGQKLNIPLQTFCRQIRHTYNAANSIPILLKLRDQSYFFLNEKLQ